MNDERLASEKIVEAHPNINDLRVLRRPTTEKASRIAAIAIQHAIFEKLLDFILDH
jgi:hypothetical protein